MGECDVCLVFCLEPSASRTHLRELVGVEVDKRNFDHRVEYAAAEIAE